MSQDRAGSHETPVGSLGDTIETTCHRFESAWQSGQHPVLEEFLAGWEEPERSKLLSELLLYELQYISRDGRTLVPAVYTHRFPEHDEVVLEVFDRWSSARQETIVSDLDESVVMQSHFAALRHHAEGGLGVVYRAGDRALSRDVALKFIHTRLADDVEYRDRFRMEAEITSRLEHPGVVPVYGLGEDEGGLFYVMRFIQGETLDDAIGRYHDAANRPEVTRDKREHQLRELLGHFIAACKTIAYAHTRGIVHRDIKPENIMLGRYGETIVIDWGLAISVGRQGVFKSSSEKTLMLSSGSHPSRDRAGVVGTPVYMSPEQAAGNVELTPASDVYSLGATLYRILVPAAPFSGSLDRLLSDVRDGKFPPPTKIDRHVSKPLEAICLKAMALDAADRYGTAMDLARDVEDFLADAPVSAIRDTWSRKAARWARRHRALSQSFLVILLILTLAGASAALLFGRLRSEAVAVQHSEHELRKHSLAVSAKFAARTIANNVDVRLRILEKEAADPALHQMLRAIDLDATSPDDPAREPLQSWLDARGARYAHVRSRCWFICAADGAQVARYPSHDEQGERYGSLAKKYSFRDYFHGQGEDFRDDFPRSPLGAANISVANVSTNDGALNVVFSAPIQGAGDDAPLGVIAMSVELGEFADLKIPLPEGQKVLLVDSRQYYMQRPDAQAERGEGLILQHADLGDLTRRTTLPHLDDATLGRLREIKAQWDLLGENGWTQNLLGADYRDPLAEDSDEAWLAAFAPVILSARPADARVRDSGFFVIVQQPWR